MSDDTPTQRFDQPATTPLPAAGAPTPDEKKSRTPLIVLIIVGAVLLAAIIVILALLLGKHGTPSSLPTHTATASATPTTTPTPTPPPTPTPTATQTVAPPPPATLTINSFSAGNNGKVACSNQTGNSIPMTLSWISTNGSQAYIGVGVPPGGNAKDMGQGWNLPPSGNQNDFPQPLNYPCYNATTTFTITVADAHGNLQSKTITVTNTGDTHS